MDLTRQMSPKGVPREGDPGLLQISKANPGMSVFWGPGPSLLQPHLNVPLSTSWPLSRTWMPSFSSEPKAMYSANAQSTVRFLVMSARPRRIRERPVRTRNTVQPQAWMAEAPALWGECPRSLSSLACSQTRADLSFLSKGGSGDILGQNSL